MFPVGVIRRWKKKNAIFLRETRTFTGNFIFCRGFWYPASIRNRIIIYLAVNDILIGWLTLQYFAA